MLVLPDDSPAPAHGEVPVVMDVDDEDGWRGGPGPPPPPDLTDILV